MFHLLLPKINDILKILAIPQIFYQKNFTSNIFKFIDFFFKDIENTDGIFASAVELRNVRTRANFLENRCSN